MGQTSLAFYSIAGIVVQTLLTGFFLNYFVRATSLQVEVVKRKQPFNRVALITSIFFFFGITAYWITNIRRLLDSVFNSTGSQAIGLYFSNTNGNTEYFVKVALYESVLLVSNCNRSYRLFLVFQRNMWVCIPTFFMIPAIVACDIGLYYRSSVDITTESWQRDAWPWAVADYSMKLFNNIYLTVFMGIGMYMAKARCLNSPGITAWEIFVGSATPLTLLNIANFITVMVGSNLWHALIDITPSIIGISFCMMIIRVTQKVQETSTTGSTTFVGVVPASVQFHSMTGSAVQYVNADDIVWLEKDTKKPLV